jgi:hypothetical protein
MSASKLLEQLQATKWQIEQIVAELRKHIEDE